MGTNKTWASEVALEGAEPARFGPFDRNLFTSPVHAPASIRTQGYYAARSRAGSWVRSTVHWLETPLCGVSL